MTFRVCFRCCLHDNRIHPLENILNFMKVSVDDDEEDLDENEIYETELGVTDKKSGPLVGFVNAGMTTTMSAKMGSTGLGSTGSSNGRREQGAEFSPIHAAAVNGDKSSLAKLLLTSTKDVDSGDKFQRTPLMYCVLGDRMECGEMLIKAGANVNRRDIGGRTALHWAAHKGNFRCLKLLLSKGANWKEKDNEGQTAMHLSTRHKSPKCLALLMKQLELGEVDDQDKNKRTALHWASSFGNLEHIKMLIKADSNIGIPDVEGKTPLHWAASSKDTQAVDCVALVLETAPSVINWQDFEGRTALHLAVADGNEAVVSALVALEKCNVSALDNMFRTPAHWAAVLGHSKIVGMLLDGKADHASSDSNGATPLHYASQNNFADTVETFLSHPAGVKDEPDIEGRTAFMWAAGKGADDVIRMFTKYKADINQTDKNGGTALHAAALAGHASSVKLLLSHGASIDGTDLLKHSPLFRACEMGHMEVVQALMDHGAAVDVLDQDGRSPLHWAALGGHAYICQTLIKFGIDPNVRDQSGRTPLQCAAYGGFVNCMSVLIEHKADPNAQDSEGMTALHWACSKGHLDSVKLLIEFHAFPNHMEFTEDRYTPLDYALMGEHLEVAQYMIEQGALSITGIQDIAALKIQAVFRGYRVRKTYLERKMLLMKHEQLRKDLAKKKAEEEYKRKEDQRHKREVSERRLSGDEEEEEDGEEEGEEPSRKSAGTQARAEESQEAGSDEALGEDGEKKEGVQPEQPVYKFRKKQKGPIYTPEEKLLMQKKEHHQVVQEERTRLSGHRHKTRAACVIQKAWRNYHYLKKGIWKEVRETIREKRLKAGEQEWQKQIAALTIQLAWRKYYRKKLLKSLPPKNRRILHMWDPEVIATKQRAMVEQIYKEKVNVPDWHPKLKPVPRPLWTRFMPSPAVTSFNFALARYRAEAESQRRKAMSFNFACGQYHGPSLHAKRPHSSWSHYENSSTSSSSDDMAMKLGETFEPAHFSYNMQHDKS